MHNYLITRALGALNRVHGGLAAGACSMVGCGTMTGVVITCRILSLTFLATDIMVFWAATSTFCTHSYLYSIAHLVHLPISLLVS